MTIFECCGGCGRERGDPSACPGSGRRLQVSSRSAIRAAPDGRAPYLPGSLRTDRISRRPFIAHTTRSAGGAAELAPNGVDELAVYVMVGSVAVAGHDRGRPTRLALRKVRGSSQGHRGSRNRHRRRRSHRCVHLSIRTVRHELTRGSGPRDRDYQSGRTRTLHPTRAA